jgi:hypothetical protein
MKKIKDYLDSLDSVVMVNGKMIFFEFITAFLGGLVLGLLLSPKKNIRIGNNNGNRTMENDPDYE